MNVRKHIFRNLFFSETNGVVKIEFYLPNNEIKVGNGGLNGGLNEGLNGGLND